MDLLNKFARWYGCPSYVSAKGNDKRDLLILGTAYALTRSYDSRTVLVTSDKKLVRLARRLDLDVVVCR